MGSAGYGTKPTAPLRSTRDETVDAGAGNEGPSELRTRAKPDHRENSARSRRDIAMDFLKVEEEALASEPLPFSRREHVLRYFTALRRQLQEASRAGGDDR